MRRSRSWLGFLAACGAAGVLVLAPAAGAEEDDAHAACEDRCMEHEQACYDACEDQACEDSCAEAADACMESCEA